MRNLVPIGRFSRLCRLTIPALRHYDELGLLRPAAIDPDTGYRYYSLAQAGEAERIRVLRSLEMPLDEIRGLLAERDQGAVAERLEAHQRRLEQRIETYRSSVVFIQRLMAQEAGTMRYQVQTRETVDQPIATVRGHSAVGDMPAFFQVAYREIFGLIGGLGVRPAGPPFSIYHDPEFKEEDVDLEVGFPVSEPVESAGRVVGRTLPGALVAAAIHAGPYDEIGPAYTAITAWIQEHGHEVAGPPREVYLTDPATTAPADHRTEVVFPIR
jgi:effector-binding domain-containing protein